MCNYLTEYLFSYVWYLCNKKSKRFQIFILDLHCAAGTTCSGYIYITIDILNIEFIFPDNPPRIVTKLLIRQCKIF